MDSFSLGRERRRSPNAAAMTDWWCPMLTQPPGGNWSPSAQRRPAEGSEPAAPPSPKMPLTRISRAVARAYADTYHRGVDTRGRPAQ